MTLVETLAVIGAIVGPIATVMTLHINRLREQDKLKFDREYSILESRVTKCEVECKEKSDTLVIERTKREAAELRVVRLESDNSAYEREIRNIKEENRMLKEKLYGGES